MRRNNTLLFAYVVIIVMLAVTAGIFIAREYYWTAIFIVIIILILAQLIRNLLKESRSEISRLIDGIRYGETNIYFSRDEAGWLDPKLPVRMQDAIDSFNKRMHEIKVDNNFFQFLLGRVELAIIVADDEDKIVWSNNATLEVLNRYRPAHISELAALSQSLPELLREMRPRDIKTVKIQRAQQEYELAVNMTRAYMRGETLRIYSFSNIDKIVERTQDEAWIKLIKILTHEIMNSISPILSLAETFGEDHGNNDPEMIQRAMKTIRRRSEGLMQFVSDYRKLTPSGVPDKTEFPLETLLEDTLSLVKSKGIVFSYEILPPKLIIKADRGQLGQVFLNLINNARESIPGGREPEIKVTAEVGETGRTVIVVSDNGDGIPADVADKIFIPFYTTKKEGSGIGLSVCRQIVTSHGGSISVSSIPGRGSAFKIVM